MPPKKCLEKVVSGLSNKGYIDTSVKKKKHTSESSGMGAPFSKAQRHETEQ